MRRAVLRAISILVVVLIILVLVVHFAFEARRNEKLTVMPYVPTIPTDSLSIEEGKRLTQVKGCNDCHGQDLSGKVIADAGPVGFFVGANITPAGVVSGYTDEDWVRAIRHGLGPGGRKLIFMPSAEFAQLSQEDLGKIIAYLKSVSGVSSNLAPLKVGPLGKVLYLAGNFPLMFQAELISHDIRPEESVAVAENSEYGKYLAASCVGCHGPQFKGGPIPGVPPEWPAAADLTAKDGVKTWSRADFAKLLKEGVKPDGTQVNPTFMPWTSYSAMTDIEIGALFDFVQSL